MNKIIFANNPLDRSSNLRSDKEWQSSSISDKNTCFVLFNSGKPLIRVSREPGKNSKIYLAHFNKVEKYLDKSYTVFLGRLENQIYYAIDTGGQKETVSISEFDEGKFIDLRSIAQSISPEETGILAQAKSMMDWNRSHQYCSKCESSKLRIIDSGCKKVCDKCKTEFFPRVDPVVIMLPIFNERCLLGRQKIFPPRMFSALAGFLEPGETIEDAVIREVKEEVGLDVSKVTYKFTQPWPFPYQLMIACFCEVESETTKLDEDEIEEAVWLSREDLNRIFVGKSPDRIWIPPAMAVAHQLIVSWMHEK